LKEEEEEREREGAERERERERKMRNHFDRWSSFCLFELCGEETELLSC